jgi:hypothetical protein
MSKKAPEDQVVHTQCRHLPVLIHLALALVLAPKGMEVLSVGCYGPYWCDTFMLGWTVNCLVVSRRRYFAMMIDLVPELPIVLGAVFK